MKAWLAILFVIACAPLAAQQSSTNQNIQSIPQHPNVTDGNGLRQGLWTIELNKDFMRPLTKDDIKFYHVIEFKDDKPAGVAKTYYSSGSLYQERTLLSFRSADNRTYAEKVDYSQPYHVYWEDGSENLIAPNRIQCEILKGQGKYELALPFANKALDATEKKLGKRNWRYAYFLNNLGAIHEALGNYTKAEPLYLEAIKITEAIGEKGLGHVESLKPLAYLYYLMGNTTRAEELYLESLKRAEQFQGKESRVYATALNNVALIYQQLDNHKMAASCYEEALKIKVKLGSNESLEDDLGYATTLVNLGSVFMSLGQYAKAQPLIAQSLAVTEKALGKENGTYALRLSFLGSIYYRTGDFQKAEALYQEVLRISEKTEGRNHPRYAGYSMYLAYINGSKPDYASAETYALRSKEGYVHQVEKFFPSLSEFEKEAYYSTISSSFQSFNSFCLLRKDQNPAILGEMYNNQLATKALLLNNASKWKQRIRSSGDKKLFALYADWESSRGVLARLSKEKTASKSKIDSLEQLTNAQEKELSKRSEMFASLSEKKANTWQEVKAKLKSNEVAIEMIRVRKFGVSRIVTDSSDVKLPRYPQHGLTDTVYYAALLLTNTSTTPELVLLKNGNELENKYIKLYSNSIKAQTEDKQSYNQFWKPLADKLNKLYKKKTADGIHVYFSPDGVYNQININTLLNPATKKYVLEELKLSLLTNTKDLLVAQKEEAYNNLAYLFGYPDYGVSIEDRSALVKKERESQPVYYALALERGSDELSELPGTKTEVENIAGIMTAKGWQPEVLTGEKALEETLKDCFKPRVLHIATHGYFEPDDRINQNPLLRSGLMLTGAGHTLAGNKDDKTEDGILTAYEAMNLNLDNTDLVVLSACETGLGEVRNGEGVYGLQRAFKVAGAKTIIMSLWKVNDEATQELMTVFYENWLATQNKHQAFIIAQQKLMEKYKSPYYWGAFVMIGD